MRYLALIAVLVAGCAHPGLVVGSTGLRSQEGYPLPVTAYPCLKAAWTVSSAEQVLTVIWSELEARNLVYPGQDRSLAGVRVCRIAQPQACTTGRVTMGPCKTINGRMHCARRRDCAAADFAWISEKWPPVCLADWPEEPFCVSDPAKQSEAGLTTDWIHGLFELALARWTRLGSAHTVLGEEVEIVIQKTLSGMLSP